MSWHVAGIVVRGSSTEATAFMQGVLGDRDRVQDAVTFADAMEDGTQLMHASDDDWQILIDPYMFHPLDGNMSSDSILPAWLENLLKLHAMTGVAFLVEGTSATYGFAIYEMGARVRCWLIQDDQLLVNSGQPSTSEESIRTMFGNDIGEQFVLRIVDSLTLSWEAIGSLSFAVYE